MCLISIGRDITDKKRAEEASRDLAHASRLAVVGQLTATIAHEINQPLGAILSNTDAAEMLLDQDSPPLEEIRSILADIRADDVRASETIRHIRTLARKREMQIDLLDLTEVAFEVMRLVSVEARRRGVTLLTEFTGAPVTVRGDRVHLQQVMMNLILNGMEAMTETPENNRRLRVRTTSKQNGEVRVSVSDSGRGIALEKLPRLFESFFTTKDDGMGLGLAVARSIIDAHGGRILAENNIDGGATFWFELPFNGKHTASA
jgi:C4-dicarboxylate-specific signal transduction histidine kinase